MVVVFGAVCVSGRGAAWIGGRVCESNAAMDVIVGTVMPCGSTQKGEMSASREGGRGAVERTARKRLAQRLERLDRLAAEDEADVPLGHGPAPAAHPGFAAPSPRKTTRPAGSRPKAG
jgi:hypothetical protein